MNSKPAGSWPAGSFLRYNLFMKLKKFVLVGLLTLVFLLSYETVLAVIHGGGSGGSGGPSPQPNDGIKGESIQELAAVLGRLINFLLGIVGAITIILIIWGGMRYIFASGDEKATLTAKHMIEYALLGLVIVLLSVFIVNFVGSLLGAGNLSVIKISQ